MTSFSQDRSENPAEYEFGYRSVNAWAVASVVLSVLSVTAAFDRLFIVIPIGGAFAGWKALRQLRHAVRAVFIMDTEAKVRAVLYYSQSTGRNFQEILRLLVAMQTADQHKVATPADWQPGDEVIVPPPGSCGVAQERMTKPAEDTHCLDWFLCLKKLPKSALKLPPIWSNPKGKS